MNRIQVFARYGQLAGTALAITGLALVAFQGCAPAGPMGNENTNGNPNSNSNQNANENVNDNGTVAERAFVGAATCQACHAGAHSDWVQTGHAGAFETLRGIGQHTNAACVGCHTVGFGETDGFVDEAITPDLVGVQCENCHGAAGAHARNPGDLSLRPVVMGALQSAAICGVCHTDAHHPTYDEWSLSRHSMALATLQGNSHASDDCLQCHSQDYRWAVEKGLTDIPTLTSATLSIECATCHAPHGNVSQAAQLRQPIANLCGQCHTQEEAMIGGSPHHPQFEMLTGVGAYDEAGVELSVTHAHTSLTGGGGQACAQCHVVQHSFDDPNEGNPNVTGHTFNPFDETITTHQAAEYTGCLICHTEASASAARTSVQSDIEARLAALAPRFDATSDSYIDPATLNEADAALLATAKFDFQFVGADGSRGVHNPSYASALLEAAETIVQQVAP